MTATLAPLSSPSLASPPLASPLLTQRPEIVRETSASGAISVEQRLSFADSPTARAGCARPPSWRSWR